MLYKVEIENFLSISEPQVIDLRARKSVEDRLGRLKPVHEGSDWRCPNVVALYGSNAAGKSNVLRAIAFGAWFVTKSFEHRVDHDLPYQKFGTTDKIADTTRLSYSFSGPVDFQDETGEGPECPYTYELVLSARDPRPKAISLPSQDFVVLEKLNYQPRGLGKPTTLIERREGGLKKFSRGFMTKGHANALKTTLRANASAIATLAQLNHRIASTFVEWISGITSNIWFDRVETDENATIRWFAAFPPRLARLQSVAKRIDLGIEEIRVISSLPEPMLEFTHSGLDQKITLPLESHGTRQFIKTFPSIEFALDRGSIALIDDIDSGIHPLLLPEIVRWFNDEERNPRGAQLWITCHSPSLMNELTKESILFCEKDSLGRSTVYDLSEIEGVRRFENFCGKYMSGEYGAVPILG